MIFENFEIALFRQFQNFKKCTRVIYPKHVITSTNHRNLSEVISRSCKTKNFLGKKVRKTMMKRMKAKTAKLNNHNWIKVNLIIDFLLYGFFEKIS